MEPKRYTVFIENVYGETEFSCECDTLETARQVLLEEYNKDCHNLGLQPRKNLLPYDRYSLSNTKGRIINNEA